MCVILRHQYMNVLLAAPAMVEHLLHSRDLQAWSTWTQLTFLDLAGNPLTGTLPKVRSRGVRNAAFDATRTYMQVLWGSSTPL